MFKWTMLFNYMLLFFIAYGNTVLKTEFQDTPSKIIKNSDGTIGGVTVDIMKMIEKKLNYKFVYKNSDVSLLRIEDDLAKRRIDVYFGMLKNEEREKKVSFIEPLYNINYILVTRADNKEDIKSIADLKKISKKKAVLTLFGSIIEDYLKSQKVISEAGAKTVERNFEKLLSKRADYFIYHDIAVFYEMNKEKYKGKFKVMQLIIKKDTLWLVASPDLDKNIKKELQITIKKLKETDEWKEMDKKYKLEK